MRLLPFATVCALACSPAYPQSVVSSGADGLGISGTAYGFATSTDGRYVSYCFRPAPADPLGNDPRSDAFLKDRTLGTLVKVSLRENGSAFTNAQCQRTAVSDDGRYVAFGIRDFDLPSLAEYNVKEQVYRRDVPASTTVLASRTAAGAPFQWDVALADMTPDGRLVLMDVDYPVTGRRAGDEYGLVLRDQATGTNLQVATNPPANGTFDIGKGSVSRDGRFVTYSSNWPQDPAYPGEYDRQAYVFDANGPGTRLVSRGASGTPSDTDVVVGRLARNGRYLLFASDSQALGIPFNTGGRIFRADLETGTLDLVTRKNDGTVTSIYLYEFGWYDADLTEDGNLVSFMSSTPLGNSSLEQVSGFLGLLMYIRDMSTGFAALGAVNSQGSLPPRPEHRLAGNGSSVVFSAGAPGFASGLPGNPTGQLLFADATPAPVDLNVVLADRGEEPGPFAGQRYQRLEMIVTNQSAAPARLIRVLLGTPAVHRLVTSDQPVCGTRISDGSPPIFCNLPSLAPGATFSVHLTVDITDEVPATLQAGVSQLDADPDPADDTDALEVGAQSGGGGGGGGAIDFLALSMLGAAALVRSRCRWRT
ncbi:MAG: hypothetical protein J0M16_12025 [Gammaproteobacteria bacterium]|nr:hypothetical protein [Gammaproteobacteria bacterium]